MVKEGTSCGERYEVLREIGRGGMGVVYAAKDRLLEREVALKALSPLLMVAPEARERFRREALTVAQLDHPGLVGVHDLGEHEGALFLVMPLVRGRNLRALMESGSLSGQEWVELVAQGAEALHHCHLRGILHRDIKPENLLVEEGPPRRARLTDFGLAMGKGDSRISGSHALLGTLDYFSPEQVLEQPLTSSSDLYSLAVVLYEGLVGAPPFGGSFHLLYQIVHEPAPTPSQRGAALPADLEALLVAALDRDPARRPADALAFAQALRALRDPWPETGAPTPLSATPTVPSAVPVAEPMVGREPELALLRDRLAAARTGEGQVVLLGGEAGIGKTRLMEALEAAALGEGVRVAHGRFQELASGLAFNGYCEVLQDYFRSSRGRSSADFGDLAAELRATFPILGEVPELKRSHSGDAMPFPAQRDPSAVFELLARALARAVGDQPLVLLLEDLHGADVSIRALEYVLRRLSALPLLVVASYRSTEMGRGHPLMDLVDAFQNQRRFLHLSLKALEAEDFRTFLEGHLKGLFDPEAAERLREATGGNPYFAKEILRSLRESRALFEEEPGRWGLAGGLGEGAALPATVQQTLERRLLRLEEGAREVLGVASVLGRSFEYKDLERLLPRPDLEEMVETLLAKGFLQEEARSFGERLAFPSPLVREVVYAEVGRRRRRAVHRQFAQMLEARPGAEGMGLPRLHHHFHHGDVPEKAVEYGLRLAQAHLEAFSLVDAKTVLRMVLQATEDLAAPTPCAEGKAHLLLARVLRHEGDVGEALRETEKALKGFDAAGDATGILETVRFGAEAAYAAQLTDETRGWLKVALARIGPNPAVRRPFLELGATLANLRGDHGEARAFLAELDQELPPVTAEAEGVGCVRVGMCAPLRRLLPALGYTNEEEEALATAFEPLLRAGDQGHPMPLLCEKWESFEGGRRFLLHLRPAITLHDGRALEAGLVAESIQHALRVAQSPMVPAWGALEGLRPGLGAEGVEVKGPLLLELRLSSPLPIYPSLLTDPRAAIAVPSLQGGGTVGTGPFRLAEAGPDRLRFVRFESYWGPAPPRIGALEFLGGHDPAELAAGLREGRFEVVRDLIPEDMDGLLRHSRSRFRLLEAPKPGVYFAVLRLGSPWESQFRCLGGLPIPDLVLRHLGRMARPAFGLLPPGFLGHDPARRHLSRCGERATGPFPGALRVAMHPIYGQRYAPLVEAILEGWREMGLQVEVLPRDMETFLAVLHGEAEADVLFMRWMADYLDPDSFCFDLFHSARGLLKAFVSDAELDRLAEAGRATPQPAQRERLYQRFENRLMELGAFLPLACESDLRVCSGRLRGTRLGFRAPYLNYDEVSLAGEESAPRKGGQLAIPIQGQVTSLDPCQGLMMAYAETLPAIYEPLTREGEAAQILPWLASEFQALEGGRCFRFRLREGLRFQDGRPVTSRDARYSFERLLQSPHAEAIAHLRLLKGAPELASGEAPDLAGFHLEGPLGFSLELSHPTAFLPALLSYFTTSLVPEGSRPGLGTWKDGCLGTGPFRVTAFDPGRRLELEANPYYWREGYPKADRLVFHIGVSQEDALQGFRSGRYGLVWNLPIRVMEALRQDRTLGTLAMDAPELSTYYLAFNARCGPCADPVLRQRIRAALPVERMVRRHAARQGFPAHTLTPPSLLGRTPPQPPPPSPSGSSAATLGTPLKLLINPSFALLAPELVQDVIQRLEGEGYPIQRLDLDQEAYLQAFRGNAHDLLLTRWVADYPDADGFAHALFHGQDGILKHLLADPELDERIERGRQETDPAQRQAIYLEMESLFARKALLVPLFHAFATRLARPEVGGFRIKMAFPHVAYEDLWVGHTS